MATGTWPNGPWINDDQIFNIYLQQIIHNNVIFINKLFLYSKLHLYTTKYPNIWEKKYKFTMKIYIIHFGCRLLQAIFGPRISSIIFVWSTTGAI